jgi:hypothetical protein
LEFRNVDFCGGRKTGEKPTKQGRESTNKLNSHDAEYGNRTRAGATVVRGERSHRYAAHASDPMKNYTLLASLNVFLGKLKKKNLETGF